MAASQFLLQFLLLLLCFSYQTQGFSPRHALNLAPSLRLTAHGSRLSAAASDGTSSTPQTSWDKLRSTLRGTNVFFVGMMGSGKTSVGTAFAKNLGYRFLDTDEIAEFMIEMPISNFFASGKEAEFRDLEYQILMEMSQYTRLVLSTGGGIVERNENWGLLHHGIVVFIDLSPEDIYKRLSATPEQISKRPLLQGASPLERLKELSEKRMEKYTQADVRLRVPPTASNEEISTLACETILQFIADNPPLWQEWKKKRDAKSLDAAAMANPKAVFESGLDPTMTEAKKGSVSYVSLQDIQSGKVQLPNSSSSKPGSEGESPPAFEEGNILQ